MPCNKNQTIYDMDLGGNPVSGDMQQELVDHTSSRVTFSNSSYDGYEKFPDVLLRRAASVPILQEEDSEQKWTRLPIPCKQPLQLLSKFHEGGGDDDNLEEGASAADECTNEEQRVC